MPWYSAKSFPLGYLQYICDLQEQPKSHQNTAKLETFLLINRRKSIFLWGYFSVSFLFFKKHYSEFEVGTFHWRPNILRAPRSTLVYRLYTITTFFCFLFFINLWNNACTVLVNNTGKWIHKCGIQSGKEFLNESSLPSGCQFRDTIIDRVLVN